MLCTIRIFYRFGVVLSINMSISMVFTLFLFSSLMLVAGPTGTFGNVHVLFKKALRRLFPRYFAGKNEIVLPENIDTAIDVDEELEEGNEVLEIVDSDLVQQKSDEEDELFVDASDEAPEVGVSDSSSV
jgi:hypothetical protein